MTIALLCFVVTLLLGVPIAFVLAFTGILHLGAIDLSYLAVVPQRMFAGVNSSSLTCIPFFIVAGELMNGGGVTKRLMEFVKELVGYVKGGLAYATIVTSSGKRTCPVQSTISICGGSAPLSCGQFPL